ncbi:hypothetical protein ILUMI_23916 [Ignelater luminosus]|uniref:Thioesterase domain-containing protein n=1 Tax=Ignelater luminosus TaxID=2038154 RepID=A0A8K0C7Y2_IGNLU|nr:hypothetical protein ILUMI_23916 [Ignelater luminosus]
MLLRTFTRRCSTNTTDTIKKFLKRSDSGFDRVLSKVKILKCENGQCLAELKVEEEHTNPLHGLHGGLSATLIDNITTFALFTYEKSYMVPSVSVDMHVSYLKGATMGDEIVIDAQTLRAGKTLAFLKCEIRNKETGDLLVTGSHTKYLMQSKK